MKKKTRGKMPRADNCDVHCDHHGSAGDDGGGSDGDARQMSRLTMSMMTMVMMLWWRQW